MTHLPTGLQVRTLVRVFRSSADLFCGSVYCRDHQGREGAETSLPRPPCQVYRVCGGYRARSRSPPELVRVSASLLVRTGRELTILSSSLPADNTREHPETSVRFRPFLIIA